MATDKVMRSVRATPEIFDRLSSLSKTEGMDQGAMLEALLNTWDVQAARGQVPERAADVADFDAHVQGIQKAFLRSLELAQSAEQRARTSLQAGIEARDTTIVKLTGDVERLNAEIVKLQDERNELAASLQMSQVLLAEARKKARLEALLEQLSDRLDSPELPEAAPKARRGRKPKAAAETAETTEGGADSGN